MQACEIIGGLVSFTLLGIYARAGSRDKEVIGRLLGRTVTSEARPTTLIPAAVRAIVTTGGLFRVIAELKKLEDDGVSVLSDAVRNWSECLGLDSETLTL